MLVLLTALFLSLWFWRRDDKEATLWMVATYLGIGLVAYTNFTAVSVAASAFPKILKDFIMLGMVGFVQGMAAKRQIPVWMAILLIFGMFAAVHYLDELIKADDDTDVEVHIEAAVTPVDPVIAGYLVEIAEGSSSSDLILFSLANDLKIERAFFPGRPTETLLDNYYLVKGDVDPAVLASLSGVTYLEPNEEILVEPFILAEGNAKTDRKSSLRINDPFTSEQWVMDVLEMDEYYRILSEQQARKKAKIVILDTGVDGTHEDLDDNFTSIETKYDTDPHGHGTHCAGIAAGVTNNGLGIGSLAGTNDESPFVEVSSVKVLSASGMGTQKTIIAGIIEAADEGADVISLSLGGRSNQSSQRAYSAAVEYAHRAGAIVVAAAGNSNRNAKDFAPANAEGIITVAAIDEHLLRAPFSNRTEDIEMAIAAPGVGIYSTVPGNQYKKYSGTSMACPFVAGLLGVMKSLEPELDHRTAYRMLHDTGLTTSETRVTGRIVQPADALAALVR